MFYKAEKNCVLIGQSNTFIDLEGLALDGVDDPHVCDCVCSQACPGSAIRCMASCQGLVRDTVMFSVRHLPWGNIYGARNEDFLSSAFQRLIFSFSRKYAERSTPNESLWSLSLIFKGKKLD